MEGLYKIGVRSDPERLSSIRGIVRAGHDHPTNIGAFRNRPDLSQEVAPVSLRQSEIEEHDSRSLGAILLGELVYVVHCLVGIVDDVQGVGEIMGREHPANEIHIDWA